MSDVPTASPEKRYSYCRNCTAYCGFEFDLVDGRIAGHRPDRANTNSDGFSCIKGEMAVAFMSDGEQRLTQCQRRSKDGPFEAIRPEEAVRQVADRLGDILDRHGPQAVAMYYGTSAYGRALTIPMAKSFLGALGGFKVFSTMTIDQSARWVAYNRMGTFATGKPNILDTDVLLMSGTNPVVSHIPNYGALPGNNQSKFIRAMQARGGKLIIIDPRRTETARLADIHLQPKPGFDADIFACLIHIVLENGWHDRAFCARFVSGLDELRDAVSPFTPEHVAARAGVEAGQLLETARIFARSAKPLCEYGTGTTMAMHGNTAAHMAEALNAICGGFVRAGDTIRNPGLFARKARQEGVYPPARSWEQEPKLRSGHGRLFGEYPTSRLADEILEDGPEKIRALIVVGANPLATWGEPEHAREAFRDLDLLVVLDPRMTETAREAHFVIPPPVQYEIPDMTMICDLLMHKPFVQFAPPVVAPPEGVIEEWKFLNGVANGVGKVLTAKPFDLLADYADIAGGIDLTPDREWRSEELLAWYAQGAGIAMEELERRPHGFEPEVETPVVTAPDTDDGARLVLCPPDVAAELAAVFKDERLSDMPYRLVSRRIVETQNTAFRFNEITQRRHPTNRLYINPADLAAEGLDDGAQVRLTGEHGHVIAYLRGDATMRPGVLSMTHGWGAISDRDDPQGHRGAHLGRLVSMRPEHVQNFDGMPLQSAIPVRLTPVR